MIPTYSKRPDRLEMIIQSLPRQQTFTFTNENEAKPKFEVNPLTGIPYPRKKRDLQVTPFTINA